MRERDDGGRGNVGLAQLRSVIANLLDLNTQVQTPAHAGDPTGE